jgi:hypothetical protein
MASTVYTMDLKTKSTDGAYTTVLSSGTAVTALTATENDGVVTITATT